jgi:HAD superfamily hydrolase (TIGR01509 family)
VIQAVVFDFDGLVFDSERHEYEAVCELYAEHGAELPLEVWGECVGREAGYFDPHAYLEQAIGRSLDRAVLEERRRRGFHQRIAGQGPLPGVEEMLQAAAGMGLKIGLASSSGRAWVTGQLERLGLLQHFACIRTRDEVSRVKPEPELYLSVLRCLGVEPGQAVAFEDSPNGALAARRAGMYCVVVPNLVTASLAFGDHHLRLESLLRVELAGLLRRLEAAGPPLPLDPARPLTPAGERS